MGLFVILRHPSTTLRPFPTGNPGVGFSLLVLFLLFLFQNWLFFFLTLKMRLGLPWWSSDWESTCRWRGHRFHPWVRKIPWRRKWQPTPVFLPGKSHGQRSLAGYSQWACKELDTTEQPKQQQQLCPWDSQRLGHQSALSISRELEGIPEALRHQPGWRQLLPAQLPKTPLLQLSHLREAGSQSCCWADANIQHNYSLPSHSRAASSPHFSWNILFKVHTQGDVGVGG